MAGIKKVTKCVRNRERWRVKRKIKKKRTRDCKKEKEEKEGREMEKKKKGDGGIQIWRMGVRARISQGMYLSGMDCLKHIGCNFN